MIYRTHVPFWNPRTPATLVTAHVGDTRIILCNTETGQGEPLTHNHHPSSPTESGRLRRYATAFVSDSFGEERFGGFANTRAFGGTPQKRMGISAEPDILTKVLAPSQFSFLVLCTDGVSGVLSDQEIVDIVKECRTPEEGAKALIAFAEDVGGLSGDNATAIVIRLGGWTRRIIGGCGSAGTKELRKWKKEHGSAEAGNRPQ
jgi:protein phosphatase PTC6